MFKRLVTGLFLLGIFRFPAGQTGASVWGAASRQPVPVCSPDTVFVADSGGVRSVYPVPGNVLLDQVTVKGPLLPDKLFSIPSSIVLLSGDKLKQSVATSFVGQLNQVPGVYVHSGALNTSRITVRGIGSRTPYATNRIKAYYNGIPLTGGDGTTVLEDIDPSMVGTVEILKGAKSALYGSGLGGIILVSGREYTEPGMHGGAGMEAGMHGTIKPAFHVAYRKGVLSLNAGYALTESDGWRQNSRYRRHSMVVGTGIEKEKSKTNLLLCGIDLRASIASSLDYRTYMNSPDSAARSWLQAGGYEQYRKLITGVGHTRKITTALESSTVGYLNLYDGYELRPFNILDDDAVQTGFRSLLDLTKSHLRIRTGIEMTFDRYNWSIRNSDPGRHGEVLERYRETRLPLSLFLLGGYRFGRGGNLEAGLSSNFLVYRLQDRGADSTDRSGTYRYRPVWSPFIGINLPVNDNIRIFASIGHGFSPPSVEETLLPEGQANPDLKPESGINLEMGTRMYAFHRNLYLDAAAYLLLVRNLLVTKRLSEDVFFGANAGSTRHGGIELAAGARVNGDRWKGLPEVLLNCSYSLSVNRFTDFIDDGIDYSGRLLPGIPSHTFWGDLTFRLSEGFTLNYRYQNMGMQYLDDGNSGSCEGYRLSSVKAVFRIRGRNRFGVELYAGIRNLFNRHYASMILVNAPSFGNVPPRYYYPGEPRYLYGGMGISF